MDLKTAEFKIIRVFSNVLMGLIFLMMVALFFRASDTILYILLALQFLVGLPMMVLIHKWIVVEASRKTDTRRLAKRFWLEVIGFVAVVYVIVTIPFFVFYDPISQIWGMVFGIVLSSLFFVPLVAFAGAVVLFLKLQKVYKNEEIEFLSQLR